MSYTSDDTPYVILINDDNTMTTTQKRRIVQRSKLVDDLWFLVNPIYNGRNLDAFTVLLEYLSPVSHKYRTEILYLSEDTYNGYLKYTLPFDTTITAEAGKVELMISFIASELNNDGSSVQRVRKVSGSTIEIVPVTAWSDIIPDEALSALDQRIIKTDAQIRALNEMNNIIYESKADSLVYDEENNILQLAAVGKTIGNKVVLSGSYEPFKDGVPVVDFTTISGGIDTPEEDDSIIEF